MTSVSTLARTALPLAAALGLADLAAAQRWVDAPLRLEALPAGFYVDHADFDGDGDEDILGQFLGDLTWAVNDGEARFTQGPSLDLDTSNVYSPKVFADFNGDGRPDIAVGVGSFESPHGVVVHFGTNDGYGPGQFLATPSQVRSLALGQADSDPAFELAFFGPGDFPAFGVGWIDTPETTPTGLSFTTRDYTFGANAHAVLDVDGDGLSDHILSSQDQFDVFLTASNGDVSFASTLDTAHESGSFVNLAVGDVDGDGDDDLVSWDNIVGNDTRFIALEQTGSGLSEHPASVVMDLVPARGFLADWDGDGDLDLLANDLSASGGVLWHQVRNDGGFDFALNFRVPAPFTGYGGGVADYSYTTGK